MFKNATFKFAITTVISTMVVSCSMGPIEQNQTDEDLQIENSQTISKTAAAQDPLLSGFKRVTSYSYHWDKPYNLAASSRYRSDATTLTEWFWVYTTDKPFKSGSTTSPRCEKSVDMFWRSGVHQFVGDFLAQSNKYSPDNHNYTCMQIFGGDAHATAFMLRLYDGDGTGSITDGLETHVIKTNSYNKWVHVNVIHDATNHNIKVYLDGVLKVNHSDNGDPVNTSNGYYFKYGVYQQSGATNQTLSIWRNVQFWKK